MNKFVARLNRAAVLLVIFAFAAAWGAGADDEVVVEKNIPYKSGEGLTEYEKERCLLDLYLPEGAQDFSTIVWFHGGGLQAGDKSEEMTAAIARWFAGRG
ncbi:MAG: hypothetical protein JXR73_01305, partial [Candidatus Omnitrophica bacterium]|nr:hypothetical protein [Candidatus Omnitrophota bacterium]